VFSFETGTGNMRGPFNVLPRTLDQSLEKTPTMTRHIFSVISFVVVFGRFGFHLRRSLLHEPRISDPDFSIGFGPVAVDPDEVDVAIASPELLDPTPTVGDTSCLVDRIEAVRIDVSNIHEEISVVGQNLHNLIETQSVPDKILGLRIPIDIWVDEIVVHDPPPPFFLLVVIGGAF